MGTAHVHRQVRGYLGKLSQPFLDRMDLCVEAPKVTYAALKGKMSGRKTAERKGETSAQIGRESARQERYRIDGFLIPAQDLTR